MRGVVRGVVKGVVRVSWGCREGVVRVLWDVLRCSDVRCSEMFWDVVGCCEMLWDVVRVCVMLWDVVRCCEMMWDVRCEIWDYDFHIFLFKLFFNNIKIHNMAMLLYVHSCSIFLTWFHCTNNPVMLVIVDREGIKTQWIHLLWCGLAATLLGTCCCSLSSY